MSRSWSISVRLFALMILWPLVVAAQPSVGTDMEHLCEVAHLQEIVGATVHLNVLRTVAEVAGAEGWMTAAQRARQREVIARIEQTLGWEHMSAQVIEACETRLGAAGVAESIDFFEQTRPRALLDAMVEVNRFLKTPQGLEVYFSAMGDEGSRAWATQQLKPFYDELGDLEQWRKTADGREFAERFEALNQCYLDILAQSGRSRELERELVEALEAAAMAYREKRGK